MKIQVLSQSFYPDHSGISLYSSEFAFYAAEKGHNVEVITGYGFYPQWRKRAEDRRRLLSTEYKGRVKILRGYIYVPRNPDTFKRVLHEISLLVSASINFFRATRPDVIVVFTTPILLGFLTAIFKRLYGCKLVVNVQDFQLEAASSLGMSKKKFLFNILEKLEKFSYKNADLVTSISGSMYNILIQNKGLTKDKIAIWPNWIQRKDYELQNIEKGIFRRKYGVGPDQTLIAYAGNIGLKQGLEILVDLAALYKNCASLKFFMIGNGAAMEDIKRHAQTLGVNNIAFLPLLDPKDYIHFLNDLDIFFLPQRKTTFDVYFPSKLLGLMAANKAVLLSADKESELYKTVSTKQIGFVTEFGDIKGLQQCIYETMHCTSKSKEISMNAACYVAQFERDEVLDKVFEKINAL